MEGYAQLGDCTAQTEDLPATLVPSALTSQVERIALEPEFRDQQRLCRLIENHATFVWRYLRRIGQCAADCDEIVQEACLVVARRMDGIREGCERAYLLQVAINVASTRRRSFSRELVRMDQTAYCIALEPTLDPEQAVEVRQARQELEAILLAMPIELRTVFVLYELEELSTPEIAQMLSLKEGTAASRLRRARAEFRRLVEQRSLGTAQLDGKGGSSEGGVE